MAIHIATLRAFPSVMSGSSSGASTQFPDYYAQYGGAQPMVWDDDDFDEAEEEELGELPATLSPPRVAATPPPDDPQILASFSLEMSSLDEEQQPTAIVDDDDDEDDWLFRSDEDEVQLVRVVPPQPAAPRSRRRKAVRYREAPRKSKELLALEAARGTPVVPRLMLPAERYTSGPLVLSPRQFQRQMRYEALIYQQPAFSLPGWRGALRSTLGQRALVVMGERAIIESYDRSTADGGIFQTVALYLNLPMMFRRTQFQAASPVDLNDFEWLIASTIAFFLTMQPYITYAVDGPDFMEYLGQMAEEDRRNAIAASFRRSRIDDIQFYGRIASLDVVEMTQFNRQVSGSIGFRLFILQEHDQNLFKAGIIRLRARIETYLQGLS